MGEVWPLGSTKIPALILLEKAVGESRAEASFTCSRVSNEETCQVITVTKANERA